MGGSIRGRSLARALGALATGGGLVLLLGGCGANMTAALATASKTWDGGRSVAGPNAVVNPAFDYLRVETGRQVGLMARAGDEPSVHGRIEPWFSADGAVLRLSQGRIVGLADGSRSWQLSRALEPVDWRQVAAGQPQTQTWVVDEQPGYRMGRRFDRVIELSLAGPPGRDTLSLTRGVRWFREFDTRAASLPAWYAVDLQQQPPRVVYAQSCLGPQWCLNWQPWSGRDAR
jgi:hypothetical protein